MSHEGVTTRILRAYAQFVVRRAGTVLSAILVVAVLAGIAASRLVINTNQLELIRQDLPEVKEVRRIIDMVGGAGTLVVALRSPDAATLRGVADDLNARLVADTDHVRNVNYRVPLDFIRRRLGLFVETEDLVTAKTRINAFVKDKLKRASPFFMEIVPTKPVELDLADLTAKYSHVGKKSLKDDYYVTDDGTMLLLFVKPMWDSNNLGATKAWLEQLSADFQAYSKANTRGVTLVEDAARATPAAATVTWGLTGTYKTMLDDSFAVADSLAPVSIIAFIGILLITLVFFRRPAPTIIVVSGMVIGTVIAMGFAWVVFGELNMITSILGGILMGFGVDYGIQFIYRTRLELGLGKPFDTAIGDALMHAGRPASVAATVTAGSFLILIVSDFRGFSQFGVLAAAGTIIIGFTVFCWSAAILVLAGRRDSGLPERLVGRVAPGVITAANPQDRIRRPGLLLAIAGGIAVTLAFFAYPWVKGDRNPTDPLLVRALHGVRFDYNTRALLPAHQASVELQDEINDRFQTSPDTVAVYTKTVAESKELFDELSQHPEKYPAIETPLLSAFTFVPEPVRAAANAKVLEEWKAELAEIDVAVLPPELQEKAKLFIDALDAKPYGVADLPEVYASQFRELPTSKPENRGVLTFLSAKEDLRDGRAMLRFADQVREIRTSSGKVFHAAGQPILYATLARTVLHDGFVTVLLAAIWILLMHLLDFRSFTLAFASVLPLVVGLGTMLGILSIADEPLNFMNIIVLPILLGFGISHGLYLLHRFLEGTSPLVALRSVGAAVASSTLTAIAGFGALLAANHNGLKSMGFVASLGLATTLLVSFTVLAAVLQLLSDGRRRRIVHAKSVEALALATDHAA